ncbi:hypothetical protein [Aquimarina sp. Aq78]|uniref:hypothetical protein n=1 Tax=Aquimarina sp. Aq78 TaxID=1191889 RepID=UPI00131B9B15|nr:hypothetical protein [Aquimarina sp. Aq78]
MNTMLKLKSIVTLLIIVAFTFSCSSDDNQDILTPDGGTSDAELIVTESGTGDKRAVSVTGGANGENVKIRIKFESQSKSMRRLYITQNTGGSGEVPYQISTTGVTVDSKKDGSLDLASDKKNAFDFTIDFPAPSSMDNGTIVYNIWATSGRGDFRDVTKRNVFEDNAVGSITVKFGTGANSSSGIKVYEATILAAPLKDGSSNTFISVFDGKIYKINQGEEFAALWDFGYYYGATQKASLASTVDYPQLFDTNNDGTLDAGVAGISGVAAEELNNFYITTSTKDFDTTTTASDLDDISIPTTERVTDLAIGDVLEFVDNYGRKGLIKIKELVSGNGSNGKITFDVKVQAPTITIKP